MNIDYDVELTVSTMKGKRKLSATAKLDNNKLNEASASGIPIMDELLHPLVQSLELQMRTPVQLTLWQ